MFTDGGTLSFRSLCSDDERMERPEETRVPLAGGGGMSAGTSAWSGSSPGLGMDAVRSVGLGVGGSGGEPGSRPPDGSLMLGGLQQASVVGHDLVLGQVQVELQRHEDGELEGYQLSPVHSEPLLQFLWGHRMKGFYGTYKMSLNVHEGSLCPAPRRIWTRGDASLDHLRLTADVKCLQAENNFPHSLFIFITKWANLLL